ncbi:thioredoxin family protein [Candidatus Parcubacteria bacterium]|nr:MAG: thioredoxin family protein [Candidatus Parcubacteria bacterium]
MLHIQVVGVGCPNCQKLESLCKEVVAENNLDAKIDKVTDVDEFGALGIFVTPGLVVNGKALSQGKIPTKHTLANWLLKEIGN